MKGTFAKWIIGVVGLALIAVAGVTGPSARADFAPGIGEPLGAFSLPRADGVAGEIESTDLTGKPAVILFWRPNQRFSVDALKDIETLRDELGPGQFHVLAVDSAQSSAAVVQQSLEGLDLSFPVLLDPQRELYGRSGVIVSPTTLILDGEGTIRYRVASHPPAYARVVSARLRYLLGQITEDEMNQEVEPTVLKIDQDLAAAWRMYNLGRKLQGEGKQVQAREMFEKAVAEHPSLAEARCALGFMQLAAGDYSAAAEHFQTALHYHPESPAARLGQAAVLSRTGQAAQAEKILLGLLQYDSVGVRVRYELGLIYRSRGEYERAVAFFEDALSTLYPEVLSGPANDSGMAATNSVAGDHAGGDRPANESRMGTTSGDIEAVEPPEGSTYLGVKACKKCHYQQWKSWDETKMASAFDLLKPGARSAEKSARQLDPSQDYTTDPSCLTCHATGYGHDGGYFTPAAGNAAEARAAKELAGVACEACHGPGNLYVDIHDDIQSNERSYAPSELFEAGQYQVDASVCAACHQSEAPCVPSDRVFDFETRKDEGTHKHYDLKFRE